MANSKPNMEPKLTINDYPKPNKISAQAQKYCIRKKFRNYKINKLKLL